MKKIYLFLIGLLPLIAHAQITITQSDLPVAGWGYVNAVDSNYSAAIPVGGATTWNYASLQNLMQDSLLFINAAGTPYASTFPNANLAAHDPSINEYVYFISNSTGFYTNGFASPIPPYIVFNPAQMNIPVPFTYNSTYSGHSRFQIDTVIATYPTRFVQYTAITMLGDGYGSLTIPNAAPITNTLRVKTTLLQTDSVYIDFGTGYVPFGTPVTRQTTNFKWLRNGTGTLVLEIDADSLGQTATRSSYLLLFGTLGVKEINNPVSINTYPNPASDKITFSFENNLNEQSKITIINQSGQVVESFDVSRLNSFSLSTLHFPGGLYYYLVRNEKGILSKGKFVVSH